MGPVRLFILGVLFYIAWRLIRGLGQKKEQTTDNGSPGHQRLKMYWLKTRSATHSFQKVRLSGSAGRAKHFISAAKNAAIHLPGNPEGKNEIFHRYRKY